MPAHVDFELGEDLVALRDLTAEILSDLAEVERVREVENTLGGHDEQLWKVLADSGLLGVYLPEEHGGAGLGALGLVTVLEQVGRAVAPVRLAQVMAGVVRPLALGGTVEQQHTWLDALLSGQKIVTSAWDLTPDGAVLRLTRAADGTVSGVLRGVPALPQSAAVIVPLVDAEGQLRTALIPVTRDGLRVEAEDVTDRGASGALHLSGVVVEDADLFEVDAAAPDIDATGWLRLGQAAQTVGVCAEAIARTAAYTSQREQFGRPLSTNQGVSLRAADAHLDTDATRLVVQRAAWLIDRGRRADAVSGVLVASWWAKQAGLRSVHATQHLHGGIGADVDYPIHRYFLWGRHAAFTLGSAPAVLAELGDALPTAPANGAPA